MSDVVPDLSKPSWLRWPPNCCETCVGWHKREEWIGVCHQRNSINNGDITDSRFRCQDFVRKAGI